VTKKRYKRWHVEFDVDQWEHAEWNPDVQYGLLVLETEETYLRVPAWAVITEVEPPMAEGYYLSPDTGRSFRYAGGEWELWSRPVGERRWDWFVHTDPPADEALRGFTYIGPISEEED